MKSLDDYHDSISPYEFFEFLYNQVISRKITSFTQLMDFVHYLPVSTKTTRVYKKLFHLIKELNWGVFAPISLEEYPALWKALVLPFQAIEGTGDLKRNTSISTVYVGMLDIHGYSAFCLKYRRNLSMLQLLDDCIQDDIRRIAKSYGVLSWRSEGDMIILVAASARSMTRAAVNITDYFSRRRIIKHKKLIESKVVNKIILPDMNVSGGIAGGKTFTPMVITRDGDISGDIINTAARLQSFANLLDPEKTRILMTNHVVHQLRKNPPRRKEDLLGAVSYFNLGRFHFKGMDLHVYEILFKKSQKEQLAYQRTLLKLYAALEKGRWRDHIYISLIEAIASVIERAGPIKIEGTSRKELLARCKEAVEIYESGTDYKRPIAILDLLCAYLPLFPNADPVLQIYADEILAKYKVIEHHFQNHLEANFPHMINKFLNLHQRDLFIKAAKSKAVYAQLKQVGMQEMMKENQKYTWYRIIDEERDYLNMRIHIGKK